MDALKTPKPPRRKTTIDGDSGWLVIHTIKGYQYYYLHIYDPQTQKTNQIKYIGPVDKIDAAQAEVKQK
ncbi:hypothetical protein ES703_84656 [subsurface metagenome]